MHLTAEGCQARGCEMHQTSRGLGFSNTAAWRGLNGYYIMKKYILLFNFWEKPFTCGNQGSFRSCLHMVAMTPNEGNERG